MIKAYCPYFGESSLARQARFFINALCRYERVALYPLDFPRVSDEISSETNQLLKNQRLINEKSVALGIGPIPKMDRIRGVKRIAFIVWETTKVTEDTRQILDRMNEIWITSEWGRSILIENGFVEEKIKIVPLGVDANLFQPPLRLHNEFRNDRFRFLCVGKWEERKGIVDLIFAFCEEFGSDERVELVLHCHNPWIHNFDLQTEICALNLSDHAPITASPWIPEYDLVKLYNRCDVFVLPTRAEGWGLPIGEAMACALPVIVTNYSAPTEFVTSQNGYLINVANMIKAHDTFAYHDQDYGYWAQPDISHLKYLMRYVFEHPQQAREKGVHARRDIIGKWTWDHAAQKAIQHLL